MAISEPVSFQVSFDVDQLGGNLVWSFTNPLDERNLFKTKGRHAGAVHFELGDQVFLEVTAFGRPNTFLNSNILDCALLTMPHLGFETWSPPSPFSHKRASLNITDFDETVMHDDPVENLRTGIQRAVAPLIVIHESGRWDLSLLLTVEIQKEGPKGPVSEIRVFMFDPESEVGTGADTN